MKKFKWLLGMLLLALVPMLQSCDDDGYSIGDFSWDWIEIISEGREETEALDAVLEILQ